VDILPAAPTWNIFNSTDEIEEWSFSNIFFIIRALAASNETERTLSQEQNFDAVAFFSQLGDVQSAIYERK